VLGHRRALLERILDKSSPPAQHTRHARILRMQ